MRRSTLGHTPKPLSYRFAIPLCYSDPSNNLSRSIVERLICFLDKYLANGAGPCDWTTEFNAGSHEVRGSIPLGSTIYIVHRSRTDTLTDTLTAKSRVHWIKLAFWLTLNCIKMGCEQMEWTLDTIKERYSVHFQRIERSNRLQWYRVSRISDCEIATY
jgi:hypothetical protein